MSRIFLLIISIFLTLISHTQFNVRFEIKSLPSNHPTNAAVYLAGSFNGWNPQNEQFKFSNDSKGDYFLEIKLDPGSYEYKITRGGWDKVECKNGGAGIENRKLKVEANTTVTLEIEEWQDRFGPPLVKNSASKQVKIIDTAFFIPQLNRVRRVWIYLPENYNTSRKRWPVLYMHDGRNLFDDATSFAGEWGIDEFMDSTSTRKCIVVGIDHGDKNRTPEYSPFTYTTDHGLAPTNKGEGDLYAEFLAKTLKPYIDKNYRTSRKRKNTFVAGSSMGGLISFYSILRYPKLFGGAGIFSPSIWVSKDEMMEYLDKKARSVKSKIYFYAGKQESDYMVPDMLLAFEKLSQQSKSKMTTVIRNEGRHNEASWRKEFPLFYEWLMR